MKKKWLRAAFFVFIDMKKTYLLGEQIFKLKKLLKEDVSGHLVVVDIQPEYENYFGFHTGDFCNKLNELVDKGVQITILYNGEDTLGMINLNDYQMWLLQNGLEEENLNYITFYDKGYAFFRYCMDEGVDEEEITNLVREMMRNNINDSRDLNKEFWDAFIEKYGNEDIREIMEYADDCISIPDLIDFLSSNVQGRVYLTGGGVQECLKEVEIALNALGKSYIVYPEFTY